METALNPLLANYDEPFPSWTSTIPITLAPSSFCKGTGGTLEGPEPTSACRRRCQERDWVTKKGSGRDVDHGGASPAGDMARPLRLAFAGRRLSRHCAGQRAQGDRAGRHRSGPLRRLGLDGHSLRSAPGDPVPESLPGPPVPQRRDTQAFNRRHRRVGPVWQGRFKAIVVEKESYLLELCRYVRQVALYGRRVGRGRRCRRLRGGWGSATGRSAGV